MTRKLSYVHLLYGAVALMLVAQIVAAVSERGLFSDVVEVFGKASEQQRQVLATVGELRANYLMAHHLFDANLLQPPVDGAEALSLFAGLAADAEEVDAQLGTATAPLAKRAAIGVRQYLFALETEDRASESPQRFAAAVDDQLSSLFVILHGYEAQASGGAKTLRGRRLRFLFRQAQQAQELFHRLRRAEAPHGNEIDALMARNIDLLSTKIVSIGPEVTDPRDALLNATRRLRVGLRALYDSGAPLGDSDNEAHLLKVGLAFEATGNLLDETVASLGLLVQSEQRNMREAMLYQDRVLTLTLTVSWILALLGVVLLVRLLRRRIAKLVDGAKRIGEGIYDQTIDLPYTDDLGLLARAFNNMGKRLSEKELSIGATLSELGRAQEAMRELNRSLEARVEERTTALQASVVELEEEMKRREALEKELMLAAKVVENVQEGIVITDSANRIISINPAYTEITGFEASEILGRDPGFAKSSRHGPDFYAEMWKHLWDEGHWRGEIWNRRKNGEIFPKLLSISLIRDKDDEGQISNCVAVFSDISRLKQSEERMEQLAFYDPLTGLPNRALFKERLERCCAGGERRGERFALLFVDLDHFKAVNDTLGHDAGDDLLVEVAKRMEAVVKRETDTVARMGGDEFTLILDPIAADSDSSRIAAAVIKAVERPIQVKDREVVVGCSVGIALFPDDGDNMATLTRNADVAMYHAKEQGRNNYQFYRGTLTEASRQRLELESALRQALAKDEFVLYYQPKWNAGTGRLVGFEALIRWECCGRMISPTDFIPLLEESRQIIEVGAWVLEQAAAQARAWMDRFGRAVPIAVNISGRQVMEGGFSAFVGAIRERHGLPDGVLEVELTESSIMNDPELASEVIAGLTDSGVPVAIDDFGTGYSSLSYIKRFRVQTLKIDRAFVRDIAVDADDAAIVSAVISITERLGIDVVLEGVENYEQVDRVHELFADLSHIQFQGYLVSPPLPAAEAERYIQAAAIVPPRAGEGGRSPKAA